MMSFTWTTENLLDATKGDLLFGDRGLVFSGVSIDSRNISGGNVFVAIKGNTYDAHDFISDVICSGVRGVIVEKDKIGTLPLEKWEKEGTICLSVKDSIRALGDLASFQLKRSNALVIAITGSNGKTTTRGLTASVVRQKYKTLETMGNFNNEIGLPLTLFNLDPKHHWAVLELGMNHPGEILRLAEVCMPEIGVITNIGRAHLEGVGTIEGVMNAKGELLTSLGVSGKAVLNIDDPMVKRLAEKTSAEVTLFGISKEAAIRAESVESNDTGISFTLVLPDETIDIEMNITGDFMVSNALAAAAVGHLVGVGAREIKKGIESFRPVQGRMNIIETRNNIHILDDTYNANPDSMQAAIHTLSSLKGERRGFVVIGDMYELGNRSEELHEVVGELVGRSGVTKLYISGEYSGSVAKGARAENMKTENIFKGTREEIFSDIIENLDAGDWVLVKGSRAMSMEKIVNRLIEWGNG
jgi:UDP-N-acetylmuramoyl-tripeptide--D-alanyl-D-alanine ligase